ncbi:MAG: glycosyltransferase family 4 protein [Hyphomicrobiales bacterium]
MKILLAHNHYGSEAPSGENVVFELERTMLERRGHKIQVFERYSDDIRKKGATGLIQGALSTPWNPFSAREMRNTITDFQPDVIHAHNTFPLLSPSIFSAAKGVGRILTLHNYRLFCPAGIPMRDGKVCTQCIDKHSVWPALKHGCYRNNRVATLPIAANVALQRMRKTWQKDIEAFIVLTDFQKDLMISAGLPENSVKVKPNFYEGSPTMIPYEKRQNRVVFIGRLSEEKGVGDLVKAWLDWGGGAPMLHLIGDGPLRSQLESQAGDTSNIKFFGQISSQQAQQEMSEASLFILPSLCFEGFPMVLREAFALGTPSLVSDLGPLPALVAKGEGLVFQGGNAEDLRQKVMALWPNKEKLANMALKARSAYEESYTEEVNYNKLISIYNGAIALSKANGTKDQM